MGSFNDPAAKTPQDAMRRFFNGCTDCDICRFLMDESCLLFPEIYRLYDESRKKTVPPDPQALQNLTDRCTLCGLCPCPDVRANVIQGKADRTRVQGLEPGARVLSDLQTFARLGGKAPRLANALLSFPIVRRLVAKIFQLHSQRTLPRLAHEGFFAWAAREGLHRKGSASGATVRIAYFTGCTAAYLFPEVAQAVVRVFRSMGAQIYVPPQQCCGMPTVVEGDMPRSLERIQANLHTLLDAVDEGFHVVCSCPTCGYFMRKLLRENACLTTGCVQTTNLEDETVRTSAGTATPSAPSKGATAPHYGASSLADDAFPSVSISKRLRLSEHLWDVGEYLLRLREEKRWNPRWRPLTGRWVYYAPCHQREQGIGTPYLSLLQEIPGLDLTPVGSSVDCCGMGGSLGYKKDFHDKSLQLGTSLVEKIKRQAPEAIVTDCLSCRLQFAYIFDIPVHHPVEVLAYALS